MPIHDLERHQVQRGAIFIGTAGWSVPGRFADAFPPDGSHLTRYAARLNAAEINSSFYRPHRRSTYERWAASVPHGFRFAVKLPKTVTHEQRLADCDALLDRFLVEAGGLGAKLGALLVQLPPSLAFDDAMAERFFVQLRGRTDAAIACEPRHQSWFGPEAETLFVRHHVARVAADPAPVQGAGEPGGWDGLAYWRLHGSPRIYYSDYEPPALDRAKTRLIEAAAEGRPAWCIFDNTAASHALGNALSIAAG